MEKKDKKDTKDIKETKKKTISKKVVSKNKTEEKKNRGNIFKGIFGYFKGVIKEIKRIRWTSGKELLKYSVATLIFVLFFGAYFYAIDWVALLVRSLAK